MRPALIGIGVALVGLSALGTVYLTSSVGQTRQALAVSADVARGETIDAEDLVAVDLPAGPTSLQPVPATDLDEIVGQVATTQLLPGSLLTASAYAPELIPAAGTSIVGVSLSASQMPTVALNAGDKVRIVETPVSGGEPPAETPFDIPATVISTSANMTNDQTIVNVEVAMKDAGPLAARAATGRVAMVIDPAGEE
jgi:hypothetical protein